MPQKRFFTGARIDNDKIGKFALVTSGCPSKPYFMPFLRCIATTAQYAPTGGLAHFYFGLDRPFANYARQMFKMIKARTDDPQKPHAAKVGNAYFPLAKETPQLQAADFLTYLTYRHMVARDKAGDLGSALPSGPLMTLTAKRRVAGDFAFFDRDTMALALAKTYNDCGNWDGHTEVTQ